MPFAQAGLPRRVAVIGAGFIGTHVAAGLLEAGAEVTVVNRSPLDGRKQELLRAARMAIVDASARELVRPHLVDVDHVIYCASGLMPADSNLDPVADTQLSLPPLLNVLALLRERPGVGITYLSSGGTVYGAPHAEEIDEGHPTDPITSYGIMKLAGEKYALMHSRLYGVPVRILRCANVFGEHQPATRSQGVIAVFLDRIARGEPIPLYGDGSIVRDFVYVGDVVALIMRTMATREGSVTLNVGTGEGASLARIVELIERVSGRTALIERRADRGYDVSRVVLDIALARGEFGFRPLPLEDGLRRTWAGTVGASRSPKIDTTPG